MKFANSLDSPCLICACWGLVAVGILLEPEGCIEIASPVEAIDYRTSGHYWVEIGDSLADYLPFTVKHTACDYPHNFWIQWIPLCYCCWTTFYRLASLIVSRWLIALISVSIISSIIISIIHVSSIHAQCEKAKTGLPLSYVGGERERVTAWVWERECLLPLGVWFFPPLSLLQRFTSLSSCNLHPAISIEPLYHSPPIPLVHSFFILHCPCITIKSRLSLDFLLYWESSIFSFSSLILTF